MGSCLDYGPLPSRGVPPLPHLCALAPSFSNSPSFWASLVSPPPTRHPPSSCLSVCLPPHLIPLALALSFPVSLLSALVSFPPSAPPTPCLPPPRVCLSLPQWLQWFGQAQLPSAQMTSLPHHTQAHTHSLSHTNTSYTHTCTHPGPWLGFRQNRKGPSPSAGLPGQVRGWWRTLHMPCAWPAPCLVPAQQSLNPRPATSLPSPPGAAGAGSRFRVPHPLPRKD